MRTIEHYIIREIAIPLGAVITILVGLFACFSSARYLAKAVTETLGAGMMLKLVLLKTLIALEVLAPIALYVSIFIGLGRMYRDREIIALRAGGIGGSRIVKSVLMLAIPISILIGALAIYARPWAYKTVYLLDASANAELNTDRFQAGRFYGNEDSGRIIYIQDKDVSTGQLKEVFQYTGKDGGSEIIMAHKAHRQQAVLNQRPQLHLNDGVKYQLTHTAATDSIVHFKKLVLYLNEGSDEVGYKRKAITTAALLNSDYPYDIAELEWRLSRPLATILLALVAVPLSRSSPRQVRGEKIFTAALVFTIYYNLTGLAQTWVEQGVVGGFPGVWWLHALMFIFAAGLLWPELREYFSRRQ
ncbi:MAG: LPS export ABC transporter permease LptF [Gammaproteobacteria bacterium]